MPKTGADKPKPAKAESNSDTSKPKSTEGEKPAVEPPAGAGTKNFATRGQVGAASDSFVGGTEVTLEFEDPIKYDSLKELIDQALPSKDVRYELGNVEFNAGQNRGYKQWTLRISQPLDQATAFLADFERQVSNTPVFLGDSKIGSRVAKDTEQTAIEALLVSIIMIVVYIWIRFQNVIYGIGAVVALVHDVLVTVAGVALSYYVAGFLGWLLIDPFKISLNVVAALLTIVGYSISDTIVIFDRIREVRGKSPHLTEEMINRSVNQTLSRTVLTVFTVLLVTTILYIAGGQAIHAFAFTMLIGLISGTYSSVYIAAPCLLWLKMPGQKKIG